MKKYKRYLILINLLLLLVYFNYSVAGKEKMLKEGQLVLLELAPVDPRSLMQGDYMVLRYKIAEEVIADSIAKRGYCIVKLHTNGVAERVRFQESPTPLNEGEYAIGYTSNNHNIHIGAESYFFQEGQGEKYSQAKFGGVRIDRNGNSLLTGLYDESLRRIE